MRQIRSSFCATAWLALVFSCATPRAARSEGLPLLRNLFNTATFGEDRLKETTKKLNKNPKYAFIKAYHNDRTLAYYSGLRYASCWLKAHDSDELADKLAREMAEQHAPVFRYGNWIGYCPAGDTLELADEVRRILKDAGEWRE